MTSRIKILICVFLIGLQIESVPGQSPRLQFRHITPDDGLSSSTVTCFLQDDKGFMWIGTYYGLNRYDGYNFQTYNNQPMDSTSLSHDLIYTVFQDSEKNLWIGTQIGLSRYDRETDQFVNYMRLKSSPIKGYGYNVLAISEDSLKNLWLATDQGLIYFDRNHNSAATYSHDPEDPNSLSYSLVEKVFIDSRKNVWVSTRKGLNLFQPATKTFLHAPFFSGDKADFADIYFTNITEDQEGNLWFGTFGRGLFRLDMTQNPPSWTQYCHTPEDNGSLSADHVLVLFVDQSGNLWVGLENGGLDLLDRTTGQFRHYKKNELNPNSLNNESVYAIYEDAQKNFWVGTFAGGINLSKFNGDAILGYSCLPGVPTGLSNNSVTCFMEDHLGKIWLGTDGGGLNLFLPDQDQFVRFNSKNTNLNSDALLSVFEDSDHQIWLGTWGGGLIRFDQKNRSFYSYTIDNSDIPDNNIFSIVEDDKKNLWLGSFQSGLIQFNRKSNHFKNYTSQNSALSFNMITIIRMAPDGRLWVGTPSGLNVFDPKTENFGTYFHVSGNDQSLSADGIHDITIESDTAIWIGTDTGLNRFNPETNSFTQFFKEDGLPDNVIKGLAFDNAGKLWVTTNKGVCRINLNDRNTKIFTKADGLQSNEFNDRSALRLKDGRILFGGRKGFNIISPEKIKENRNIPRMMITGFSLFNEPIRPVAAGSPLKTHVSNADQLTLSYKHSVITFQFTAMDFTAPEKNQYAFMMEGFENEWNYVGTQHTATYTNLSPGKYVFRVKGSNNDGVWNEEGVSLRIAITPPFWQRWWFRGTGFFLLVGLMVASYKLRTTRIRTLNRELELRVKERTAQLETTNRELEAFSYSVSHDLRAPLRAMDGFSGALLEDYAKNLDETGRDYLHRIRSGSQHMGRLIDDLLKLSRLTRSQMHHQKVDIGLLTATVAEDFRHAQPERKVEFIIEKPLWVMGDPSLLKVAVWNLIDNAWKFTSRKPEAQIEFGSFLEKGERIYYVRDNGVGFDMNYVGHLFEAFQRQHTDYEGTGIGLTTVQRIIHRHGGRIWAEGKMNEGATFYFTLGKSSLSENRMR